MKKLCILIGFMVISTICGSSADFKLFLDVYNEQSKNESAYNIAVSPFLMNKISNIVTNPLNRTCNLTEYSSAYVSFVIMIHDNETFQYKHCHNDENSTEFLSTNDEKIQQIFKENDLNGVQLASVGLITFERIWMSHFKTYKYGKQFFNERANRWTFPQAVDVRGHYPYFENDRVQLVRVPIQDNLTVELVLSKKWDVHAKDLIPDLVSNHDTFVASLNTTKVVVRVPRFTFTHFVDLNTALKNTSMDGIVQIINFEKLYPEKYVINDSEDFSSDLTRVLAKRPFLLAIYSQNLNQCLLITLINEVYYGW